MRIAPELEEVLLGKRGMLRGIEVALEQECLISAVALMHATIDAVSALTRPKEQDDTSRQVFEAWVKRFLLPGSGFEFSASDLYAARCGVLHTSSSESRLEREQGAMPLVYQWSAGPPADQAHPLPTGAVVVRVESLHRAIRHAVALFLKASEAEPDLHDRVAHHLRALFCYVPWPTSAVRAVAS